MNEPMLLLLVGVPPTPSSLRVRVWRRLRSLGAVPLKRSAYLLPDTPASPRIFREVLRPMGTGQTLALLPPQNATGNWIKVVQRVPVRIAVDANELARHPLRVGLSMDVEVDVA